MNSIAFAVVDHPISLKSGTGVIPGIVTLHLVLPLYL